MDIRSLTQGGDDGRGRTLRLIYGYVSHNRPLPATFDDPIWVIVPSHSSEVPYGPLSWPREHGSTKPVAGTEVLLGFDDRGSGAAWVIRWVGNYTP